MPREPKYKLGQKVFVAFRPKVNEPEQLVAPAEIREMRLGDHNCLDYKVLVDPLWARHSKLTLEFPEPLIFETKEEGERHLLEYKRTETKRLLRRAQREVEELTERVEVLNAQLGDAS